MNIRMWRWVHVVIENEDKLALRNIVRWQGWAVKLKLYWMMVVVMVVVECVDEDDDNKDDDYTHGYDMMTM